MSARGARGQQRPTIDLIDFARVGGELGGVQESAQFARLRELLFDDPGRIEWQLRGERRPRPEGGSEAYLALRLGGTVVVQCNRCLQGVEVDIGEERLFKVLPTETQAERFDAQTDECDALVADPRFDVLGLIEDEAILALPISPRHELCALPEGADQASGAPGEQELAERPNPFAALAALKRPGSGGRES